MIILAIRTDSPVAELYLYDDLSQLQHITWEAHRQLADTIHTTILDLLTKNNYLWNDIGGIVMYQGPGSFTGLRIGCSVANALASGLSVPIVGTTTDDWLSSGIQQLMGGANDKIIVPIYGAEANITLPKK